MIELGKQYKTRDGREVRVYAVDGGGIHTVHGAVQDEHGWCPETWTINGHYDYREISTHYDLIEFKPRHRLVGWLNIYPGDDPVFHSDEEGGRAAADNGAAANRVACIRIDIEYEEGEGLE